MNSPIEYRKSLVRRPMSHKGDSAARRTFRVICVAVCFMMGMAGLLYVSVAMSPSLLRGFLQDVLRYESSGSSARRLAVQESCLPEYRHLLRKSLASEKDDLQLANPRGNSDFDGHGRAMVAVVGNEMILQCNPCPDRCRKAGRDLNPLGVVPDTSSAVGDPPKFKILLGILTMAGKVERRSLLRLAYGIQKAEGALVSVRFVIGALENDKERVLVGLENAMYGDIIVLDCKENLNEGKTYHFFSKVAASGESFDYVMKADDDSYIRTDNLAKHLSVLPTTDLYYGYILPCENANPYNGYMAGMGYLLSWDLVEWLAGSPMVRNNSIGVEDKLVGQWLDAEGKGKTRINNKPFFYDHPDFGGKCSHELVPETILVHQLKTPERWTDVLKFFELHRFSQPLVTTS